MAPKRKAATAAGKTATANKQRNKRPPTKKRARTDLAVQVFSEPLMRNTILGRLETQQEKSLAIFGLMYNGYISRETAREEWLHHVDTSSVVDLEQPVKGPFG